MTFINFCRYSVSAFLIALSSISFAASSSSIPSTLISLIQAEAYTAQGGTTQEVTTDIGGGFNVTNISNNDWLSYLGTVVNIPTSGAYQITYRVAGSGSFRFKESKETGGTIYDSVSIPATGGGQNWVSITRTINLTAGNHNFGIVASIGGFNINWFKIEKPWYTNSSSSKSSISSFTPSSKPKSSLSSLPNSSSSPQRSKSSTSSLRSLSSNSSFLSRSSTSSATYLMGGAIQGKPLNIATVVSTFAGKPLGADGAGAAARLEGITAMVRVGTNLYVTTQLGVRKIVIATGEVTTFVGGNYGNFTERGPVDGVGAEALFHGPKGITSDGTSLYVTDTNTIRKVDIATRTVTTFAGSGDGAGLADGGGRGADFYGLSGITIVGNTLYAADTYNRAIRKIDIATGQVTTFVRDLNNLEGPRGITTDGQNLYVTDASFGNIRKIVIATGAMTTIAGAVKYVSGSVDGVGVNARFSGPTGITYYDSNLYVTDSGNNTIRKVVLATGDVTTIAGTAGFSGAEDNLGKAARFSKPIGLTISDGEIYIADSDNQTIRKMTLSTSQVSTYSGRASDDGIGSNADFDTPFGVTTDGNHLYVADSESHLIRKITLSDGDVSTIAGNPYAKGQPRDFIGSSDGVGTAAEFNTPQGITTDGENLYVADSSNYTIRKIVIATGAVSTIAGLAKTSGCVDGIGAGARFEDPIGITTDGKNLFVADRSCYNVRKIVIATGAVTTIAGSLDGSFVSGFSPSAITTDSKNVYVVNGGVVRKIVISTGAMTVLTLRDSSGANEYFYYAKGITTDGTNLYVTDETTVRKVVIATGEVTRLAGIPRVFGKADGIGTAATFTFPAGITTDGFSLFVADSLYGTIRKIQ
ncbi:MAG: carbohydrate-binding protein [Gammaproteobacteria bacterium]|nr:MAG: carbohydrate-binding protein [Gammaproteobacteria bacterium]